MWWLLPRRWSYYGWQYVEELGGEQVQTDYTQNDSTAKDYIKNRPGGYETGFEITWNGDTDGRVSITTEGVPYVWYKVSDKILTLDQLMGGMVTVIQNGVLNQMIITDETCLETEFGYMLGNFSIFIAAETGDFNIEGLNIHIPESGVYFVNASAGGMSVRVSSLSNIIAHPFDEKYIPDTIARKAELDSRITEKEVILTSSTTDSTKKFKITVNDSGTLTATEIPE